MEFVCQRCGKKMWLFKESFEDGTIQFTCSVDGWHTLRLPRHSYEAFTQDIPTMDEFNKKAEDWK